MSYVILFDVLECRTLRLTTQELIDSYPPPFRLLDGDGNHYYYGRSVTCDDDAAFAPLNWAKNDSGCTTIEYVDSWGEWSPL